MSASFNITPGVYYAGVSRPFFVSRHAVESRAEEEGFASLVWHDRQTSKPPVDPKRDTHYSDSWDEWVSATYVGKPRVLVIPRPSWVVAGDRIVHWVPPTFESLAPKVSQKPEPEENAGIGELISLAAVGGALIYALKKLRRRK